MKTLRIVALAILVISSAGLFAQTANVETASINLKSYKKESTSKDKKIYNLTESKKAVDEAVKNPSTSNDPKMWLMRARTYAYIYTDKNGEEGKSIINEPDAIKIAVESIVNCHKSEKDDKNKKYSRSADGYNIFVEIAVYAKYLGDIAYNNKEYDKSVEYYNLLLTMFKWDDQSLLKRQNITKDGVQFNIATTQKLAGQYDNAKASYNKLIEKTYNDPWIYLDLYDIYLNIDNDTAKAIETIDKGRMYFDDNADLRRQQIYIYSVSGRSQELINILDENIEMDPYNAGSYYYRGIMYDQLGDLDKAEEDYKKAIENNDEFLPAYEDLGKLYYNRGAKLAEEANTLGLNETEKYNELNGKVKEAFMLAIPNFEQIYELSTDDKERFQTAQVLMSMYLKTEQMDKYKALKAEFQ